ncbi:ABC transporter ATP-binding protein [Streptomyces sp. S.PB5]|uniref:oligopeptide/dipeptide ABC transporter ATP-binding protein n=1 Tax=Streptomyces sp. S.PB5 TaxID=3020844 RepID=UPI0025AF91F7|nr:ABC transporter ATP-binding protein [Streptomyces sp. S.PB5]MDN3025052.1 ABC transporter ATP-binding protein [Streptomyces sp. S.PB5]
MRSEVSDVLLSVRDLRIGFGGVEAVRGLSFDVHAGEVLALVGESGAGKSLTARALLGMLPAEATVSGTIRPDLSAQRGRRIALVPQDALSALSPVHPVGDQLAAAVRSVARVSRTEARSRAVAALDRVGIPDAARRARAYPHEFSGGMRQRAVIAMATINEPDILIADEPTTALDEERRDQVLKVLTDRREAVGAALVLVTHDLDAVRRHADRALVMYAGRLTELGPTESVLTKPLAPYTAGLLASLPQPAVDATGARDPRRDGDPQRALDLQNALDSRRALDLQHGRDQQPGRGPQQVPDPEHPEDHQRTPGTRHALDSRHAGEHQRASGTQHTGERQLASNPRHAEDRQHTPNPQHVPDRQHTPNPEQAGTPRPARGRRLPTLPGTPPSPGALPPGCAFAPRCARATDLCHRDEPEPTRTDDERLVACHHREEV